MINRTRVPAKKRFIRHTWTPDPEKRRDQKTRGKTRKYVAGSWGVRGGRGGKKNFQLTIRESWIIGKRTSQLNAR